MGNTKLILILSLYYVNVCHENFLFRTIKGYRVVWCGVVWCGVVWCGVVWCGVVWCGVVWCGVVWCGVWYGMVWYGIPYIPSPFPQDALHICGYATQKEGC